MQIRHAAEVNIRIRLVDLGIGCRAGGNIGVDHIPQAVARLAEGAPDDVGADADVVWRVSAGLVRAVIARVIFRVLPRAEDEVGIVVHTVAVEIHRADGDGDAKILRRVRPLRQQMICPGKAQGSKRRQHQAPQQRKPLFPLLLHHACPSLPASFSSL